MIIKRYLGVVATSAMILASGSVSAGSLANTPEELLSMLASASLVTPEEYKQRIAAAASKDTFWVEQSFLPQTVDEATDPYRDITAKKIEQYNNELVEFSRKSKADGELLWGRVQGTKYERMAFDWAEAKLKSFGFDQVYHDKMPSGAHQWRPTRNELKVTSAPSVKGFKPYRFNSAAGKGIAGTECGTAP